MNIVNLEEAVKRLPFVPFEVVTSSGRAYKVDHSEQVWLTPRRTTMVVAEMETDGVHIIDVSHISSLEHPHNRP